MQSQDNMKLILTCECCGRVEKRTASDYQECLSIYQAFHCPVGCGKNLLSYIALPSEKNVKTVFFS